MNNIRKYLVKKCKLWKLNSLIPYVVEFTVLVKVNMASLKEYSKLILLKDNIAVKSNNDITKISIVKKYLFISFVSKLTLEKINLFIKTFFGLLNERIWFKEYFVKE